jgi:parvulin-like peptidyl-prolyl isomerase
MKICRTILLLLPAGWLVAQTPTPPPAASLSQPQPKQGQPQITLTPAKPTFVSPAVPADRVVISVGETKLTAGQLEQIIESLPEQYRNVARGPGRKEFGQNMARVLVLAEEGKRRKIDETPEYKTQMTFQSENLLAGKAFAQIGETIKIDEADARKYYDAHKNDYEQVRARHILIRASGSPSPVQPGKKELTDAEALAKAQEIRKKLDDGGDFAALASAESDDTGSQKNGGELNFFHRGQMVAPFEQAAFALNVGQISEPVKSPFGYHIIKVEAKKGFEESKPDIERKMRTEQAQKQLEELEKKSNVVLDPEYFGAGAPASK